jgi:fatty acid desaturase
MRLLVILVVLVISFDAIDCYNRLSVLPIVLNQFNKFIVNKNGKALKSSSTIDSPPVQGKVAINTPLNVRIDDVWYDLSKWRKSHPAGEHWIDLYKGRDATEVMHAFHSDDARKQFPRIMKSKESVEELNSQAAPVSQLTRNFRDLRNKLEKDGWWKRDYLHEARLLSIWATLFVTGLATAKTMPILATVCLALANVQSGWIGHDYAHGVDKFSFTLKNFAAYASGLSPTWWSDKHNKHHALTNEIGVDEDLATEPVLYVYPPNPKKDNIFRKFQHYYFFLPLSLLFAIWRLDSATLCIKDSLTGFKRKSQFELLGLVAHYSLMAALVPLKVFIPQVFLAGFITAVIVTVTHQSEELFEQHNPDFVDAQFKSTRNAKTRTVVTDWLWGGMQWQLEHHLFPSMPRSKYPALSKVLKEFAIANNIEYRITDELDILVLNWKTYQKNALAAAIDGQKHYEGKAISWGGRGEVVPV